MKILSVDTASKICSVAILEDTTVLYENTLASGLTHSENLMPMIQQAFDHLHLCLNDIHLFACNKGPGSFTGIRIGISTIKAFVDVCLKPAIGVSSLEGLAYNTEKEGLICSLIDAKHDNVYCGLFRFEQNRYIPIDDFLADSIDTIIAHLKSHTQGFITFVGDGAILHQDKIKEAISETYFLADKQNEMNAVSIGKAAYFHYLFKSSKIVTTLSPLYLRKSQAERMLEEGKSK